MAMYEPLRESFRELNRLLVDRQQFNAQQTAREAQDRRDDMALASRLEDQAFNRVMAEKRMMMQQEMNESTLQERKQAHDLALEKFEYDKEKDEFKRDIDTQVNERAEEVHNMNFERRRADQEEALAEIDELIDNKTPRPAQKTLEGFGLLEDPSFVDNQDAMNELAELMYGEEARWDSDKKEFTKVGTTAALEVSKNDINNMFPALLGLQARYANSDLNARKKITTLNGQISTAEESLKAANARAKHDVRFQNDASQIKTELEKLKSDREAQLESLKPEARLDRLEEKAEQLNKAIAYATDIGAKGHAIKLDKDLREVNALIEGHREAITKAETGGKSGQTQQRFAVRLDSDGNIMEMRLLNTAKGALGGMLPATFDEKLTADNGWVWGEQLDMAKKLGFGSQDKRWLDGYRVIKDMYGTTNTYTGNWEMEKGKRDEFQAVQKIYTELLKSDNKLMAGEAANQSTKIFQEIMENHSTEVEAALTDYANARTPEEKAELANVLRGLNEDAAADLDYAPLAGMIEERMQEIDNQGFKWFGLKK
jgi:hypothetical protein